MITFVASCGVRFKSFAEWVDHVKVHEYPVWQREDKTKKWHIYDGSYWRDLTAASLRRKP